MNQNLSVQERPLSSSELDEFNLFEKRTIVEMSNEELAEINGGTTPVCFFASMGAVAVGTGLLAAGYQFGQWLAS